MIIDAHSHLYLKNSAKEFFWLAGEREGRVSLERFARRAMAEPVDLMILSAHPDSCTTAGGMARANADAARLAAAYPGRLAGLCQVNPLLGSKSVAQMEKHIRGGRLCGVGEICPYILKYDSGDPREYPIIEKAMELDSTILYHSSAKKDSDAVDRMASDFPGARFVMAHMGGMHNWPCGIEVARRHDNVWVDTSGFVMLCHGAMARAFRVLGPSKILFGVDFPLISAGPLVAALRQMRLARRDYERIAWRNAAELFKLDARRRAHPK